MSVVLQRKWTRPTYLPGKVSRSCPFTLQHDAHGDSGDTIPLTSLKSMLPLLKLLPALILEQNTYVRPDNVVGHAL